MTLIKDLGEEEHLTEDSVETPAEEDAESYVGHMPDGEDDDVEDMLEETGMYQEGNDPDAEVEEVNVAKQVKKAELARRGIKKRTNVRSAVEPSEFDESQTKDKIDEG